MVRVLRLRSNGITSRLGDAVISGLGIVALLVLAILGQARLTSYLGDRSLTAWALGASPPVMVAAIDASRLAPESTAPADRHAPLGEANGLAANGPSSMLEDNQQSARAMTDAEPVQAGPAAGSSLASEAVASPTKEIVAAAPVNATRSRADDAPTPPAVPGAAKQPGATSPVLVTTALAMTDQLSTGIARPDRPVDGTASSAALPSAELPASLPQPDRSSVAAVGSAPTRLQTDAPLEAPARPKPACAERVSRIVEQAVIVFPVASHVLPSSEFRSRLALVARALDGCREVRIEVAGHTDPIGPDGRNFELSWQRAEAVAAELRREGVSDAQLTIIGYGARKPKVRLPRPPALSNVVAGGVVGAQPAGDAQLVNQAMLEWVRRNEVNRRVELIVR